MSAVLDASNPTVSAWVSANAGSGKTYVLTNRVIRLLLDDTPPSRLLCLTYTRAAAAEMRARVFDVLGRWALADDATLAADIEARDGAKPDSARLARARRLFATALETPGGLKIQTIHAFCERLVARFPMEANAPVPFSVLTEAEAGELKAGARLTALERLGADGSDALMEALAPFINADGFEALFDGRSAGLIARYGERDPWAAVGLPTGATPKHVMEDGDYHDPGRVAFFKRAAERLLTGGKTDVAIGQNLLDALALDGVPERFEALTCAFVTSTGTRRATIGTKPLRTADPGLFDALDNEIDRAMALRGRRASAESAAMAYAVSRLGQAIAELYREAKRQRGALDFDDLIEAANHLLRDSDAASWALYKLDGGLDHILIDEAQDTSPMQWAVVEKLAEEFFAGSGVRATARRQRTLFAVGDEKQSIFSFQGADPAEFARFRKLFSERAEGVKAPFLMPTLNESRRSARPVLSLADAVFDDPELRRAVSGGDWADHIAHRAEAPGTVEIWPLAEAEDGEDPDDWTAPVDAPTKDDPATRLAETLARTIKGWIGRETVEDRDGRLRPMQAGDVLILVRSRGRLQRAIIRKLKQVGVAVAGADRLAMLEHIAVKDLIAYGRAVLLPQDDLNLAALLRSPFFDLSEDELFHLAHGRQGSLWGRLNAIANGEETGAIDASRAKAVRDRLAEALNRLGRDAPFDFYARLMAQGGGRRAILQRLGEEAEDVIDEFLAAAAAFEDTHASSLENFLHMLEAAGGEVKRDPDAAGGAVRVLTAHGAKGLEAPVVILPDTMSLPHGQHTPNLLYHEGALVWKPSNAPEAEIAKLAYQSAEHDEHKRLLYVALTRPRDRLIVCGVKPGRAAPKGSVTWYEAVRAGFERLGGTERVETPLGEGLRYGRCGPLADAIAAAAETASDLPAWTRLPTEAELAVDTVRPSRLAPALRLDDGAASFGLERGRSIHRLLQTLPDLAPEARRAAGQRFLEKREIGGDGDALLDRVLAILDDPAFAAAFAPGSRAEVPIAGRVRTLGRQGFVSGQVDRLAVTDREVFVIDYKTNRRVPDGPEKAPRPYLNQLALYRDVLMNIFPGRRVRAALLWTEAPILMDLPDFLLDEALESLSKA